MKNIRRTVLMLLTVATMAIVSCSDKDIDAGDTGNNSPTAHHTEGVRVTAGALLYSVGGEMNGFISRLLIGRILL